jgi:hypothetical protein
MSLTVEDGTGLDDADSYVSVAQADAYHTAMGNATWTGEPVDLEAALRRATQYIDARYTFRGDPVNGTQALSLPRVIDGSALTWPLRNLTAACSELALRALAGPLVADEDPVAVTKEIVGSIEVDYARPANGGQVRFALVDNLLRDLVAGGVGLRMRVERA